jgi:hypothetical protein
MSVGGVSGQGPVGIPEHYQPHPGDWVEGFHTEKAEKQGDNIVLHGPLGVGVLNEGTITVDAQGTATAQWGGQDKTMDAAELDVLKKRLVIDEQGSGKKAKLCAAALERLDGVQPAGDKSVLTDARFGEIKRDVKGGLSAPFGFGVDQGGTVYATAGGKLSMETHIAPMKPGTPQPMSAADCAALAQNIRMLALTMTPPNPLWGELLNDATKGAKAS